VVHDTLPMFPLGTVLFPHAVLPLHVFEPRYREMTKQCLAGDREFGVVLIERGHEVGGGDTRFDVGTVARIEQASELDDGRWVLVSVGIARLRVTEWLPDAPYPQARVERIAEPPATAGRDDVQDVEARLRRALAMRVELGEPSAPLQFELSGDVVQASYEAAALAPIGPLDAQRLLTIDDAGDRLALLRTLLIDECAVLERRLSGE
jgi:Lon protease-like protein